MSVFLCLCFSATEIFGADSPDAVRWNQHAQEDYQVAQLLTERQSHYASVCFHAHQAVEKKLKGALYEHGIKPKKTHETQQLARRLMRFYPELEHLKNTLRWLDGLYVPSRYPEGKRTVFNEGHAEECLRAAEVVMNFFENHALRI